MAQIIKHQIAERFLSLCDALMLEHSIKTDSQFSDKIGINRRTFSDIRVKRIAVSTEHIYNLSKAFPSVDAHYIITGAKHFEQFKSIYIKDLKKEIDKLL